MDGHFVLTYTGVASTLAPFYGMSSYLRLSYLSLHFLKEVLITSVVSSNLFMLIKKEGRVFYGWPMCEYPVLVMFEIN